MKEIKVGLYGTKKEKIRYMGIFSLIFASIYIFGIIITNPKLFLILPMFILLTLGILIISVGVMTFSRD